MNKKCVQLCLVLSGLFITATHAYAAAKKEPIVMSLKDAVLLSLRDNPNIKQAEVTRISQKFAVIVAKNQFQPQYTFNATAQYNYGRSNGAYSISRTFGVSPSVSLENHYGTTFTASMTNPFGPNTSYNPTFTFQVVQPLIQGFGKPVVEAALRNALDDELINRLSFKNQAITTITTTISDYLNVVSAYQQLKIDYQTLYDNERTVKDDRINIAAGKLAGSEIVQAQSAVATAKAQIAADQTSIKSATNTLLNDLGLPPETKIKPPDNFQFQDMIQLLTGGAELPDEKASRVVGVKNSITYQTQRITIRTLERSLLVAKNSNEWQLNLTAEESRGGGSGDSGGSAGIKSLYDSNTYSSQVGLALNIPIDNVNNQSAIVNAEVSLENAKIQLQEQYRQLIETINTDYFTLKNNYTQLLLSQNALNLQKQTYNYSQQKYAAGLISQTDLLTVQDQLILDKQSLLSSEISYINSIASFEQDLGVSLEPWRVTVRY